MFRPLRIWQQVVTRLQSAERDANRSTEKSQSYARPWRSAHEPGWRIRLRAAPLMHAEQLVEAVDGAIAELDGEVCISRLGAQLSAGC